FRLRDHLANLARSADAIGLRVPLSADELAAAVADTLRANDRADGYVRVIVTRGAGTLGLDPRKCEPTVVVIAEEVGLYPRGPPRDPGGRGGRRRGLPRRRRRRADRGSDDRRPAGRHRGRRANHEAAARAVPRGYPPSGMTGVCSVGIRPLQPEGLGVLSPG